MTLDSAPSVREELPAHGAWVRKLARSLVRDEASADDLAQEAALAALRHERSSRGALGPWLARVTRNFARRGWRDTARRVERERAAARPERQPGADEAAERLELTRLLVDELAALEPAQRIVLVRRYFDGWSAARIARERGEPAATVRWRLQRGLAELRARLDRRCGGDGVQWRLALVPLCGTPPSWTALGDALRPLAEMGAIQGALTMKAAVQVVAAGALLAAVGVGVWWQVSRSGAEPRAFEGEGAPLALQLAPAAVAGADVAPASAPAREPLPVSTAPEPEAPEVRAERATARIEGRCVDERLVPVRGARVRENVSKDPRSTESRSDGLFSLTAEPGQWDSCTVVVEADGFATRFLAITLAPDLTQLGDVVLAPDGSVRGRVEHADGRPCAGATVVVTGPHLWDTLEEARATGPIEENSLATTSAPDGTFVLRGASVGPVRAWAGAADMRWAVSPPVEVRAHEDSEEVVLVLEPKTRAERITGVVLSPAGEPVPNASLSGMDREGGGMSSLGLATDERGRFELAARPRHVYDLEAFDPEARWAPVERRGIEPGTLDLEFRFQPARWIDLHVQARDGRAVEEFLVAARGEDEREDPLFRSVAGAPHPGGNARVLVPGQLFYVRVEARGFAPGELGPFVPGAEPAALTLELVEQPGVSGRVLADGRPVAGARVALYEADPSVRIDHQGYPSLCAPHASDETTTDGEGRFLLNLRQASTWIVRAEAQGLAPADVGPLPLDPRVARDDLELVLGPGGALEGRVRVAPGRDPAGVIVVVNRGDAHPRSTRSDEQGLFRFEGLMAGEWHLARGSQDVNSKGGGTSFSRARTPTVIPFDCTVRDGQTTHQDLDLTGWEPCELAGVLHVNGAPAAGWSVMAWPGDAEAVVGTPPSSATGADGRFTLTIDESGPVRLSFSPPAELGGSGRIDARTELHPGANDWRGDIATGSLRGRCLATIGADEALFFRSGAGVAHSCWLQIEPDADGRFVLPFVPAGRGSVQRYSGASGEWITLVETEVRAGAEQSVDVP